jgi:hypothetical protein
VVALVGLWRTRAGERMPLYGRGAAVYTWATSGVSSAAMLQSLGAADFAESADRWWVWWVIFPLATPLVLIHRKLTPRTRLEQSRLPLPSSSLALGPGERVVWTGTSTWRRTLVAALLLFAVAAITASVVWSPAALVGLVVSACLLTGARQWTVIDRRGATVHGLVRVIRLTIPLDEIRTASASADRSYLKDLNGDADDSTLVGAYMVNRRGPALTVEFGDGQVATISVDEADEAADVLNGLLARLRADARRSRAGA